MWKVQPNHFEQSIFAAFAVVVLATTSPSLAQFNSGSDGSDGALDCAAFFAINSACSIDCSTDCTVEIDLAQAANASWDTPSPVPGKGVYDAERWAVVFKFTTIDIPFRVSVTFSNHPSGAPVVWLATQDVRITGSGGIAVNVSGSTGSTARYAAPGPGGFAGGAGFTPFGVSQLSGSAGYGPGAGERGPSNTNGGGGGGFGSDGDPGFGTNGGGGGRVYGNPRITPFIGGSGGGGTELVGGGGGAGGGAILIASSGNIDLAGGNAIRAGGGPGPGFGGSGSGGAIRLVANTISGPGLLRAVGGSGPGGFGGVGRIRLEAFNITSDVDAGNPLYTATDPGPVFPPAGTPTLKAVMVDSVPISPDPRAGVQTVDAEVLTNDTVTLHIEATNIPIGTIVDVIVAPAEGASFTVPSTPLTGSLAQSTATAQITLPSGTTDIVLRAEPTP